MCLIPVGVMLFCSIDIYYVLQKAKRRVQPGGVTQLRRDRLQRQMLLLMLSSIMIFLFTTLPVSVRQIISAYDVMMNKQTNFTETINHTAIFTILLNLNYAVSQRK